MATGGGDKLVLGKYRVVRKLGAGGMSEVYEALNAVTGERVALKTFLLENLGEANRVRLEREAEALGRFQHPNIVRFHELGSEAGHLFCVLELVVGESLAALIERRCHLEKGLLPLETVLAVARGVGTALQHAHENGVLHRDVKPDNILVEEGGRVVLGDFGLAKVKDMFSVTRVGQVLGTVVYMAPEQMRGEPVDERTDVYQYGLTLYEAVAGSLPFGDEPPLDAMKRRLKEAIPPLRPLNDQCPPALEQAVLKCLAPKPAGRWSSMQQVLGCIDGLPPSGALSGAPSGALARRAPSGALPRPSTGRTSGILRPTASVAPEPRARFRDVAVPVLGSIPLPVAAGLAVLVLALTLIALVR